MIYDDRDFYPGQFREPITVQEVNPGTTSALYEILNGAGTLRIGWLVEIAGSNVVSEAGYTWIANQAYWFWTSGGAFPGGFRIALYALNTVPNFNPAAATQATTSGPFDLATQVTPASGGNWWTIAKNTTSVGYLNLQVGGNQNWYETAANLYLTITGADQLIFTSTGTAPLNTMYRASAAPVAVLTRVATPKRRGKRAAQFVATPSGS